ncbi:MAG TPA: glycosyltransferase [Bacilli bacterium]
MAGVSVITVTNRPGEFHNALNNYLRQKVPVKEWILILNNDRMDVNDYRRRCQRYKNIFVYQLPAKTTLGRCLNYGIRRSRYPLIAKFDDDDYYSPYYLKEQSLAFRRTHAGVVGKNSHLKYLQGPNLVIMEKGKSHQYVTAIPGGTIMFRRSVFGKVQFPDRSKGEDSYFLARCMAKGIKLYATSPYNFVGIRKKNIQHHTWKVPDKFFLRLSRIVAKTANYQKIAIRKV